MTREESVVSAPRALGAPRQLDEHDAPRREAAVERIDGCRRHLGLDHGPPAVQAVGGVLHREGVDARERTVDELRHDAQVCAPPVAIRELFCRRHHQGERESGQVALAVVLDLVEQSVAARLDRGLVLCQDRADHAAAVVEVILERSRVALVGLAVDLAQ